MIRTTGMIALAALALAPAGAQETPAEPQHVLVVVAHPDDELFMAPAIAALAREGAQVTLAYATRGDVGPGVSGMKPGEKLGEVRRQEALCAGEALGASAVANYDRGDGKLAIDAQREGSPARNFLATLEIMVRDRDLILTWGPDGGYGHADHRMVSALMTQVVQALPAAKRPKLLYVGIPNGSLPPVPEKWRIGPPPILRC